MKRSQASTVAIATKIALLLALAAGSPGLAAGPEVCVLAPQLDPSSATPAGGPRAVVPLSRPTLFLREPLAELRIERGGKVLWSSLALQGGSALEGPLAWPLAPLKPGEAVIARLRPLGAAPDHFASIQIEAASPQRLREGEGLLRSLMGHPGAWRPAIEALLAKGDQSLATALLFAHEGPNHPDLNALRRQLALNSCQ